MKPLREIRSFVLRQGKITKAQKTALNQALATNAIIGVSEQICDLDQVFDRGAPKIIEIGFGMGHATWQIAKNNPLNDYIGIEVHLPGIGALLNSISDNQITNLKLIRADAVQVLKKMIADNSITGFHIYFPDPWPKKRHHKRRIVQAQFVELLATKLISGGYIHLATDWAEYATWMLNILARNDQLINTSTDQTYVARPNWRPLTKFEARGLGLEHQIFDIIFTKR